MEKKKMSCPLCEAAFSYPEKLEGQTRSCPKCGADILLGGQQMPERKEPSIPSGSLPERMKANKAVAGKICPGCDGEIDLGDNVYNCPSCGDTMHLDCYEEAGRCASDACLSSTEEVPLVAAKPVEAGEEEGSSDMKECRSCGEKIKIKARKCRYCGEMQNAADIRREKERKKRVEIDDKLNGWEILFGIFCGLIACIVGIVWICQGKKKGYKLILVMIITQVVAGLLGFIAEIVEQSTR